MYKQELEYNPNYTGNISRACQPELNEVESSYVAKETMSREK